MIINSGGIHSRQSLGKAIAFLLVGMLLLQWPLRVQAFALLGPFEPGVVVTNGMSDWGGVGSPKALGEEYRWNVPVLTYGFDESFLDYFGSNGVAAVEEAIGLLNALPRASDMVLTNFSRQVFRRNAYAESLGLVDLKTAALSAILEQMGLDEPQRHIFDVRKWDDILWDLIFWEWQSGVYDEWILERNYDPVTWQPSQEVNGNLFAFFILPFPGREEPRFFETEASPETEALSAVRDQNPLFPNYRGTGEFAVNLSHDDAGGLRYLLHSQNINYETVLPGVRPAATNETFVNGAYRPGVEKIAFVRHPDVSLSGMFDIFTNRFEDRYFLNGNLRTQTLERVSAQPDIVFTATDTGREFPYHPVRFLRSGTSNWINQAALRGEIGQFGPGTIVPPARIAFAKEDWRLDSDSQNDYAQLAHLAWAKLDATTNPPVIFPASNYSDIAVSKIRLHVRNVEDHYHEINWQLRLPSQGFFDIQTSSNLVSWVTLTTFVNQGLWVDWYHYERGAERYFRIVPR